MKPTTCNYLILILCSLIITSCAHKGATSITLEADSEPNSLKAAEVESIDSDQSLKAAEVESIDSDQSLKSNGIVSTDSIEPNIFQSVGVENIVVGQSTRTDVITTLGDEFHLIDHNSYSYEMSYEQLGLSFYYRYRSSKETIFDIAIRVPFIGKTDKGIVLGESTMNDVIALYGQPSWETTDVSETWWAGYSGIEFHVKMDPKLPRYPLNKEQHINRTIIRIDINE